MLTNWDRKDEWQRSGKDFLIVVRHYTVDPSVVYEGPHRWNVYAYIYPKHRAFGSFEGPTMYQPAASALPLHGGPSFLCWHYNYDKTPCSVQVGSDYSHLYDDRFHQYATPEDAHEVFSDADELFWHLAGPQQSKDQSC